MDAEIRYVRGSIYRPRTASINYRDRGHDEHGECHSHGQEDQWLEIWQAVAGADKSRGGRNRNRQSSEAHGYLVKLKEFGEPAIITAGSKEGAGVVDVCFGSKADICSARVMSALPPKADMCSAVADVR
jgi:hypothetical protein